MSASEIRTKDMWIAALPNEWASAPDLMTVTTLGEIEKCPRRWSLRSADYSNVWAGRGYPSKFHFGALEGSVIHQLLQTLTGSFVEAGCRTVTDESAVTVMRKLGGWTKLIADSTDQVLSQYRTNPRVCEQIDSVLARLRSRGPEIRTRAQALLAKVPLSHTGTAVRHFGPKRHAPLAVGIYPEFELRCPDIGWRGRVDVLVLSAESCEIIDFKTGTHDADHAFQLLVYALLWYRDVQVNPDARIANKLTLAYGDSEESIGAPTPKELNDLERDLVGRKLAATQAVMARPPEARPNPNNCRWCDVRHLCDGYWNDPVLQQMVAETADTMPSSDAQVLITGRHGERSWDGIVEFCGFAKAGAGILVRTSQTSHEFTEGQRIRVLDAKWLKPVDASDEPAILTLGDFSEAFVLPRSSSS